MRIGLDARWIFKEITGIGSYTRELIQHLAGADHENEYVLIFADEALRDRALNHALPEKPANFSSVLAPFGIFSAASQIHMPGLLRRLGLDVYHSPNYMIPLRAFSRGSRARGAMRAVVTIHDLIPLIHPEYVPRSRKRRLFFIYKHLMREIARRANAIITVSRASRADVIKHLGMPPHRHNRVAVVTEGVSSRFRPLESFDKTRNAPRTILWVGRSDPYKNLAVLIQAFARLRSQIKIDARLKLAGPIDERYPEPEQLAKQLGVAEYIDRTGYMDDDALVRAYQEADVFVLPSLYEGFGLTVLEAMACGAPVVCSNKGSLPEVAGKAAVLVQPSDVVGFSEAIKRILLNPHEARKMRLHGIEHARSFTWDRTAEQTIEAYRMAMAQT